MTYKWINGRRAVGPFYSRGVLLQFIGDQATMSGRINGPGAVGQHVGLAQF